MLYFAEGAAQQMQRRPGEVAHTRNERKLIHEILPVGILACNCHVIGDPVTLDAIVIDPGDETGRIEEVIRRHGLKIRAILNTHSHIDHVGGLAKMRELTGAPVLMHEADLKLYREMQVQADFIGLPAPPLTEVDEFLREGKSVRWGNYDLRVMHTPGHTEGSVCLYLPGDRAHVIGAPGAHLPGAARNEKGMLFAGDTLFAGSIGRTDLWGGSFDEIMRSLQTKVLALPDDTIVFPGHGPATTIGGEREINPFLRGAT
jgi:hydroxyacylglutathione hydrolase